MQLSSGSSGGRLPVVRLWSELFIKWFTTSESPSLSPVSSLTLLKKAMGWDRVGWFITNIAIVAQYEEK